MKITETFRNNDYFKLNSDNIKIENKAYLETVTAGTYKIKWLFSSTVSELSNFEFSANAEAGYKFKLFKNDKWYWYTAGAWAETTENNDSEANTLTEIQTNIATFITSESEFNLLIIIVQSGSTGFEIYEFSFDTDSGINDINEIRRNILDVKIQVYPDYMINNDIKQGDKLLKDELQNFIDFTLSPIPNSVIELAKYQTYIKIFEAIYYEQIKSGENINDITYWTEKYDNLIEKIKSGEVLPDMSGSSTSTEDNADSPHFGMGEYGQPLGNDDYDEFTEGKY